jgi:hypothetical protein
VHKGTNLETGKALDLDTDERGGTLLLTIEPDGRVDISLPSSLLVLMSISHFLYICATTMVAAPCQYLRT